MSISTTTVYPYHYIAPSRGLLVTLTHAFSSPISRLFWIKGERDEYLASNLCMLLKKSHLWVLLLKLFFYFLFYVIIEKSVCASCVPCVISPGVGLAWLSH